MELFFARLDTINAAVDAASRMNSHTTEKHKREVLDILEDVRGTVERNLALHDTGPGPVVVTRRRVEKPRVESRAA